MACAPVLWPFQNYVSRKTVYGGRCGNYIRTDEKCTWQSVVDPLYPAYKMKAPCEVYSISGLNKLRAKEWASQPGENCEVYGHAAVWEQWNE